MNDTVLLFTGIGVFGLMLIAVILTVVEFAQMDKRGNQGSAAMSGATEPGETKRSEDRD